MGFFHLFTPYPGTDIYDQFEREGRLLFDGKWWLHPDYRYNVAAFQPANMTPDELGDLVGCVLLLREAFVLTPRLKQMRAKLCERLRTHRRNLPRLGNG